MSSPARKRIFLAGIMQGSRQDSGLCDQGYRQMLKQLLGEHLPEYEVYDPLENHRNSVSYKDEKGKDVFFRHNRMAAECEILLAFVPEASMGTAIEMWEAYCAGRAVFAISPLSRNWTVKFCSHGIFPDLAAFEKALASGELLRLINKVAEL